MKVLLRSRELGAQWGEEAVAVTFRHGAGEVCHMISLYYLQRTDLRTARHRSAASGYWTEKGVALDGGRSSVLCNFSTITEASSA